MTETDIQEKFGNKTRIFVQDCTGKITDFLKFLCDFQGKEIDFFSEDFHANDVHDFIVFISCDLETGSQFRPNISLILESENSEKLISFSSKMVSGGAMILPETLVDEIESTHFFRKIGFPIQEFSSPETSLLSTDLGKLSMENLPVEVSKNIIGIQKLTQQIGVIEEDFYEALVNY